MRSIEQAIAELNPGTLPSSQTSLAGDSMHADGSLPPPPLGSGTDAGSQPKKKPSRFWFYLYHILYWSALGSLPVHLLLLKGETKDTKEKQEWKIAVLTDMRDKLKRGESIEEEEALLSVGMDRSKREEQVDDKYFEDLLKSAEKQDFYFGKDKDIGTAFDQNISLPTPAPASAPAPSTVPRKPAPPKSERSYL
ncbi:hypothetical protein BGX27_000197 [Mortierella sp. AM989]|nr:hypothetical protein BGX27_000197 [Mortierella sp. AM989]